ncbi:GNAT family N-acetyltransferase [Aneurinibacillus sp. BA2021]|nr:GNAT family N-acetyltransferase [Aneurinibacillus sp. BA2021]
MEHIEIRPLRNRHEREQVYELWEAAFPESKTFFIERLEAEPTYELETTWVASVEGHLAAAVQVFPFDIWCGEKIVSVAGIGNVATHPDYRGRGLTHHILRHQLPWMKEKRYDLSLLFTGIPKFYEKLGWVPVQEAVHTFHWKQREDRLLPATDPLHIHSFRAEDKAGIQKLYDRCSQRYRGARVRSESYWEQAIFKRIGKDWTALVARQGESPVAYLLYRKESDEVWIQELCWEPQSEAAAAALLARVHADEPGVKSMALTFPDGQKHAAWERAFAVQTVHKSEAMWRILSKESLIEKTGRKTAGMSDEELVHSLFSSASFLFWGADKF